MSCVNGHTDSISTGKLVQGVVLAFVDSSFASDDGWRALRRRWGRGLLCLYAVLINKMNARRVSRDQSHNATE